MVLADLDDRAHRGHDRRERGIPPSAARDRAQSPDLVLVEVRLQGQRGHDHGLGDRTAAGVHVRIGREPVGAPGRDLPSQIAGGSDDGWDLGDLGRAVEDHRLLVAAARGAIAGGRAVAGAAIPGGGLADGEVWRGVGRAGTVELLRGVHLDFSEAVRQVPVRATLLAKTLAVWRKAFGFVKQKTSAKQNRFCFTEVRPR